MSNLLDKLLGREQLRKQLVAAIESRNYYRQQLESLKWVTLPVNIPTASMWNATLEATQAEATELRAQLNKQTALANAWKIIANNKGDLK